VEIIDRADDQATAWDKPNPDFIESQARAAPLFLFRPAHYMKKLHGKYTPEEEILKRYKRSAELGQRSTGARTRCTATDNVDLPTLNPVGRTTTASPAQRFVFVRNPFYPPHRRARGSSCPTSTT
jgi:peptide/nickel transport system substrate-binding protein